MFMGLFYDDLHQMSSPGLLTDREQAKEPRDNDPQARQEETPSGEHSKQDKVCVHDVGVGEVAQAKEENSYCAQANGELKGDADLRGDFLELVHEE